MYAIDISILFNFLGLDLVLNETFHRINEEVNNNEKNKSRKKRKIIENIVSSDDVRSSVCVRGYFSNNLKYRIDRDKIQFDCDLMSKPPIILVGRRINK